MQRGGKPADEVVQVGPGLRAASDALQLVERPLEVTRFDRLQKIVN